MKHWTFASDESGKFDDRERSAHLIAGVLIPGNADEHATFGRELESLCRTLKVRFPPHATELRSAGATAEFDEIRAFILGWLKRRNALCLGLVVRPQGEGRGDLLLHLRVLSSLTDLVARFVSLLSGEAIDFHIASRNFELDAPAAAEAASCGQVVEQGPSGSTRLIGVIPAAIRESVEGLRRSPIGKLPRWPTAQQIIVASAKAPRTHVAVFIADFICNEIYAGLRLDSHVSMSALASRLRPMATDRIFIGDFWQAAAVRRIDQALRLDPPDFARATRHLDDLRVSNQTCGVSSQGFTSALEGAQRMGDFLWTRGVAALRVSLPRQAPDVQRALKLLAGACQIELDLRHGSYDSVARALDSVWSGESEFACDMRRLVGDRELAARLWRISLECANHRGDVRASQRALNFFGDAVQGGASISLLAELLRAKNLSNVALQNQLPAEETDVSRIFSGLCHEARSLEKIATNVVDLATLCDLCDPKPTAAEPTDGILEQAQPAGRLGATSVWENPDYDYGHCLGTVARSLAFAGHWDEATQTLIRARRRFLGSPRDLKFNASVIARVELDRARCRGAEAPIEILKAALQFLGVLHGTRPDELSRRLKSDAGVRFDLDLALRALLWAPESLDREARASWVAELARAPRGRLFEALDAQRSHPTELVARHAAELLGSDARCSSAVRAWYNLSLAVSGAAPEGTLRRLGVFTQALAEHRVPRDAVQGSLMNPTFEYR